MVSIVQKLHEKRLINPPAWLPNNIMFEGITGSYAYGCNKPGESDFDIVGFAIPPKSLVFPHLAGFIPGYDNPPSFNQFQQHHIEDKETRKQYDIAIYSIVKFFSLAKDNNPNMVDVLYVPRRAVMHSTGVYEHVRQHRDKFLHKGSFHRFTGYASSQLTKMDKKKSSNHRRQESIDKHGYDTKFAYHLVRLAMESEQILKDHTLVLDRDRDLYKAIRAGQWTRDDLLHWWSEKNKYLNELYHSKSTLRDKPDEDEIRQLLLECLEMHYGSLSDAVTDQTKYGRLINELEDVVNRYRE